MQNAVQHNCRGSSALRLSNHAAYNALQLVIRRPHQQPAALRRQLACSAVAAAASCVQVEVVHQVAQLPPVLHPFCEVGCAAAQLLRALTLHQVAPVGSNTQEHNVMPYAEVSCQCMSCP
jgi:hypothetical protein